MMNLEELKNVWASVDERLGKQELLNGSIIREMIRDKSDKSLRKLLNHEVHLLVFNLFSIPLLIALLFIDEFRVHTQWSGKVFVWTMVVVCSATVTWQLIKIVKLMKVDFTKSLRNNFLFMNRFNIWIKKEKIVWIFITPLLYCQAIWLYALLHVNVALWIFLACGLLFGLFLMFYMYKRIYNRNIDSIRQSLEELKELEEKQE
ncbi:MAG: hypothetical protein LBS55_12500 [Prevotellaceae bacterium]|jgi:hypothetical protein|nr:hypothetical protein [Prevotellaceae bacterium]